MSTIITNSFEKLALSQAEKKTVSHEFNIIGLALFFSRIVIVGISVFCSYHFVSEKLNNHITNQTANTVVGCISSLIIESFGAMFMGLFFKYLFIAYWRFAVPLFLATALFFSLSFYTATTGLALKQYQSYDVSSSEILRSKDEVVNINNKFAEDESYIKSEIDKLRKNTWKGKLDLSIMKQIGKLQDNLIELKQQLHSDIEKAEAKSDSKLVNITKIATDKSSEYYNIVAFIMALQLIFTGIGQYIAVLVESEKAPLRARAAQMANTTYNIQKHVDKMVDDKIDERIKMNVQALTIQQESNSTQPPSGERPNLLRRIGGFLSGIIQAQNANEATVQIPEPINQINNSVGFSAINRQRNQSNNQSNNQSENAQTIKSTDTVSQLLTSQKTIFDQVVEIGVKQDKAYIVEAVRNTFGNNLPKEFAPNSGVNEFCRSLEKLGPYKEGTIKGIIAKIQAFDNAKHERKEVKQ